MDGDTEELLKRRDECASEMRAIDAELRKRRDAINKRIGPDYVPPLPVIPVPVYPPYWTFRWNNWDSRPFGPIYHVTNDNTCDAIAITVKE